MKGFILFLFYSFVVILSFGAIEMSLHAAIGMEFTRLLMWSVVVLLIISMLYGEWGRSK